MTQAVKHIFSREGIPELQHYLLLLFAFSLPFGPAINNIVSVLIVLVWLIEGQFKKKYLQICRNPIAIWAIVFFMVHVIGLLWTENLGWGVHIVGKEAKFLLIPVFMTAARKEHIKSYVIAFLLAMSLSEIISYLIWFELIPPTNTALKEGYPSPFMEHHSYTPFLAFAVYILLHEIFFDSNLNRRGLIISLFFTITMSFNLFIAGGRAGQVGFFIVYGLILLQYFHKSIIKAFLIIFVSFPLIFFLLYSYVPNFQVRIIEGVNDIRVFDSNPNTAIGLRAHYVMNTVKIIEKKPLFGEGTGDFPDVYRVINNQNSPLAMPTVHPHNMYLLVLAQLGIFGLFPLIMIFYSQIRISRTKQSPYYRLQLLLPLFFIILNLSDCYLLGHFTLSLFVLFSAILYGADSEDE